MIFFYNKTLFKIQIMYEFIIFYFKLTSIKIALWDGEMSQWVKVLAVKLNKLSITPRVHTGEGETKFQRFL